jgi:DNA polymerase V
VSLFAVADCNNFYCSCERVFHPELNGRPVVVLSNNDGCVIARSEEAKKLGLKMGDPFFQVRELLERERVAVFSSNYTLYGSMSGRVMSLLSQYTPSLDVYSIDEAFLDLSNMGDSQRMKRYGEQIARRVHKATGIPISVGIAPTKTLDKRGSKFAKKYKGYHGCCLIDTPERRQKALELFPVEDVWGIGRRIARQLAYYNITTAADFARQKESWVRSKFSVTTVRTWKELNGESCIVLDDMSQKKSICTSRSFAGQGISDFGILEEAVANFASRCAAKLRHQRSCCQGVTVFAHTSPFREDVPSHFIQQSVQLSVPTQDTAEIIKTAVGMLRENFPAQESISAPALFKKAGVIIWNITSARVVQQDLFDTIDRTKQKALLEAIDEINRRNGHDTVRIATQGTNVRFGLQNAYLSHQYTTNIDDVIVAKIK